MSTHNVQTTRKPSLLGWIGSGRDFDVDMEEAITECVVHAPTDFLEHYLGFGPEGCLKQLCRDVLDSRHRVESLLSRLG